MDIQHLPAQSRLARLWRNGGGFTRDIAVFPDDAGDDGFLWRASIATITDAGPFSSWPGVDRTLLVLRGQLTLGSETRGEIQLDERTSAFAFAGEEQVVARPPDAPCLVLNLMVRRGRTRFRLLRQADALPIVADQTLLLATQSTTISVNGLSIALDEEDALLLGPDRSSKFEIDHTIIAVEFSSNY